MKIEDLKVGRTYLINATVTTIQWDNSKTSHDQIVKGKLLSRFELGGEVAMDVKGIGKRMIGTRFIIDEYKKWWEFWK